MQQLLQTTPLDRDYTEQIYHKILKVKGKGNSAIATTLARVIIKLDDGRGFCFIAAKEKGSGAAISELRRSLT